MKTYNIQLLTLSGVINVTYTDNQPLEQFETEILQKYGQFTTLKCVEVK